MDDEIIVENMKAVLKSTKKKKAATHHNNKTSNREEDDELISSLMNKNWQMKSPIDDKSNKSNEKASTGKKVTNAFEKLMSAKTRKNSDSPLTKQASEISPPHTSLNNSKKKRKYQRKMKLKATNEADKFETESDLSILDEESLMHESHKPAKAKSSPTPASVELVPVKKRGRPRDSERQDKQDNKKRKTRDIKVLLDSNENSLENSHVKEPKQEEEDEEEAKVEMARPRRSCSNRINYALLLESPEKESPVKKSQRRKQKLDFQGIDDDEVTFEIVETDENSPIKQPPQKTKNAAVKLAPLFMKKVPKPALDPSVVEARRNFLLSELPANLRAPIEKQRKFEDEIRSNQMIAFPKIAHVRQSSEAVDYSDAGKLRRGESLIQLLPSDDESESCDSKNATRKLKCGMLSESKNSSEATSSTVARKPVLNIKDSVRAIKVKCENFPTNRCFKQILSKLKSARNNDVAREEEENVGSVSYSQSPFIDIFRPTSFEDFLLGTEPVRSLQEFLTTWNERPCRNDSYDWDEESNSRHSMRGWSNFVVLSGRHGSGKSSSVYALANDLNYEVIEINAGSKRNGKKILQDLLEATQSHRVEKHLFEDEDSQTEGACGSGSNGTDVDRRTIILVEDAELTFENDEGFLSSLQQLINISKRPVILTTNDRECPHLQKFLQHNEIIYDNPKSYVSSYLSLISLATSNFEIDDGDIEHLYARNGCDMRKTINEIEFFIRSDDASTGAGGTLRGLFCNRRRGERHNRRGQFAGLSRMDASVVSSRCVALLQSQQRSLSGDNEISYHQHNFMSEMANYFENCNVLKMDYEHDFAERRREIISRSIANVIATGNASTRAKVLDISPMLRNICRSELGRETTRRSNRNHYLKYLMPSMGNMNDYFDEQAKIFEKYS